MIEKAAGVAALTVVARVLWLARGQLARTGCSGMRALA